MRALLSVSDKTGLVEFARSLRAMGVELVSTGGTAEMLRGNDIEVSDVAGQTGFPEIMGGRVKTLHPHIHAPLLARTGVDDEVLEELGLERFDILAVNLYPFSETIARTGCTLNDAIENIDIGGPAMLRAAAKNNQAVAAVVDPEDYDRIIASLKSGSISQHLRSELAAKVFAHTAHYDAAVAAYLLQQNEPDEENFFPDQQHVVLNKHTDLRYGENPHQRAAFYTYPQINEAAIGDATLVQGKALSFNNIADADTALECVRQFYEPACVIVKHANPCGVAIDTDVLAAYQRALSTDSTSAFGGIIALNRSLDASTARE
ncbi:MAG: bifunctional phosphoribosylaminoimidazolecarboxamide formyltransferase/IMP cyclohydrolase, partial [Gammaproteobacteria bacterium]|nr:bifunctional phosphoribosylaminoimidazolecarboxamide formyltransferase/IMP cyclohydrolase [Gammaproteobacteria bacterium]